MTVLRLWEPTCRYQVELQFGRYIACGKPAPWAHQDRNVMVPVCPRHKAALTRAHTRFGGQAPTFVPVEARV